MFQVTYLRDKEQKVTEIPASTTTWWIEGGLKVKVFLSKKSRTIQE